MSKTKLVSSSKLLERKSDYSSPQMEAVELNVTRSVMDLSPIYPGIWEEEEESGESTE